MCGELVSDDEVRAMVVERQISDASFELHLVGQMRQVERNAAAVTWWQTHTTGIERR